MYEPKPVRRLSGSLMVSWAVMLVSPGCVGGSPSVGAEGPSGSSGGSAPGTSAAADISSGHVTSTSEGETGSSTSGRGSTSSRGSTDESSSGGISAGVDTGGQGTSTAASGGSGSDPSDTDSGGEQLPADLDLTVAAAVVEASVYTHRIRFPEENCAVIEGCVAAPGDRRLLRFATSVPNVGAGDFVVGRPAEHPERFERGACSGGDRFRSFLTFRLLTSDGREAVPARAQPYAVGDSVPFLEAAGSSHYPSMAGAQGTSMGWSTANDRQTSCQWLDITGVQAGQYQLEITANRDQAIHETDFSNNVVLVDVTIGRDDPQPEPPPPQWTCSANYYWDSEGCECGCGIVDPDCANTTLEACNYCGWLGSCDDQSTVCAHIDPTNNAACLPF